MKHKTLRARALTAAGVVSLLMVLTCGSFFWYVSDYYPADAAAMTLAEQGEGIEYTEGLTVLVPETPGRQGLIFYPGAKVQAEAYLPLLEQLRQEGLLCVLVHMPFRMAIFDGDAALSVIERYGDVEAWYLAGHSMGGAMASSFASEYPEQVEGLILLGAYPYKEYPLENTLTVYGSLNTSVEERIDYTENVIVIQGGNHAQFGNYGPQKGDARAEITAQVQQDAAVEAIVQFILEG